MKDINNSLETLFSKMDDFINSKTVVGDPIQIGDTTLLPLINVSFGVGATAKDKKESDKQQGRLDGGGVGAKISPSAVIVVNQKTSHVQLVNVKNQDAMGKIIDMAPGILAKIQESFKPKNKGDEPKSVDKEKEIMKKILENDKDVDVEI